MSATHAAPKKRRPGQRAGVKWRAAFLEHFKLYGIVRDACEAAGVETSTYYRQLKRDPEFAAEVADATELAADVLERVAHGWATTGVPEETVTVTEHPDGSVTTVTRRTTTRSPYVLIQLLKARRPEKFRERYEVRTEASPVAYDFSKLSTEELATVYDKLAKAAVSAELASHDA